MDYIWTTLFSRIIGIEDEDPKEEINNDLQAYFLNNTKHFVRKVYYNEFAISQHYESTHYKFNLNNSNSHFIKNPQLHITFQNKIDYSKIKINNIIKYFDLEVEGSRIFSVENNEYNISILNELYKQNYIYCGDKTIIINLPMDLAARKSIFPMFALSNSTISLNIQLNDEYFVHTVLLNNTNGEDVLARAIKWHNDISLNNCIELKLRVDSINLLPNELIQLQNKFSKFNLAINQSHSLYDNISDNIKKSTYRSKLCITHLVKYIYFYIVDKSNNLVTNRMNGSVELQFNGIDFFDMSLDELRFDTQKELNYVGIYCLKLNSVGLDVDKSSINLGRIDTVSLKINFENEDYDGFTVHMTCIHEQILQFCNGIMGMKYSK